jgi:hypothetical protein
MQTRDKEKLSEEGEGEEKRDLELENIVEKLEEIPCRFGKIPTFLIQNYSSSYLPYKVSVHYKHIL